MSIQCTTETNKLKVKKKCLKNAKLFGEASRKALKEKLEMAKKEADSIDAAGPKGDAGGELTGDEMKEEVSMASPPLTFPPPDEAEALDGAKVGIWSDAYGKVSWGERGGAPAQLHLLMKARCRCWQTLWLCMWLSTSMWRGRAV